MRKIKITMAMAAGAILFVLSSCGQIEKPEDGTKVGSGIEKIVESDEEPQAAQNTKTTGNSEAHTGLDNDDSAAHAAGEEKAGTTKQAEKEEDEAESDEESFNGETELEDMMKKMEGLSSQVINGHFSISDRLNFNTEIEKLTNELNRMSGGNTTVTKTGCFQLSQKISSLMRSISDAAVYRNSARTIFMVNSKQPAKPTNTRVDIML